MNEYHWFLIGFLAGTIWQLTGIPAWQARKVEQWFRREDAARKQRERLRYTIGREP